MIYKTLLRTQLIKKDLATQTQEKNRCELGCSGRVSSLKIGLMKRN